MFGVNWIDWLVKFDLSALFTKNIYKRFIITDKSEKHYIRLGRIASTIAILFVLIVAMNSQTKAAAGSVRKLSKDDLINNNAITNDGIKVQYDDLSRTLQVIDSQAGLILQNGVVHAKIGGIDISTSDKNLSLKAFVNHIIPELRLEVADTLSVRIWIGDSGTVWISAEGNLEGNAEFQAESLYSRAAIPALLEGQRKDDYKVLFTTFGPAEVPQAKSLFYPEHDLAMTAEAAKKINWRQADTHWQLHTSAGAGENLLLLRVHRHYYRDEPGVNYYAAFKKRSYWKTAPVVAMSFYGILKSSPTWHINFCQKKEWLYPQIDWISKNLLPYAGKMVFQLDDNYAKDDDAYVRDISDYIRSKGMIPGIWITPFTVAPEKAYNEHPEWFLHDPNGRLNTTFGSYSYGWWGKYGQNSGTLNVTNKNAVEAWYGRWWEKAGETWNFDFFKIDGQPCCIRAYSNTLEGGGIDGYRQGLKIARSVVGPDKFINACGPSFKAIGLVEGSRTGRDTGYEKHAVNGIIRWNFLNNIVWWCDPDAAAVMYKDCTVERARFNAQARILTGQQFLTDDIWTEVPPDIYRVWQLSLPSLDIYPVNLYQIKNGWEEYDIFDLKIAKAWGKWDVVGLFNYSDKPKEKNLSLSRLALEAEQVHVFEFWSSTYVGLFNSSDVIKRPLKPYEGQVFAVVPANDSKPVLLSTSRHISQGALDVENIWVRKGKKLVIKGRSSHLVKGDEYEIVFFSGKFRLKKAKASAGPVKIKSNDNLIRISFIPDGSGADWELICVLDNM